MISLAQHLLTWISAIALSLRVSGMRIWSGPPLEMQTSRLVIFQAQTFEVLPLRALLSMVQSSRARISREPVSWGRLSKVVFTN